jgi:hypothetical protein
MDLMNMDSAAFNTAERAWKARVMVVGKRRG